MKINVFLATVLFAGSVFAQDGSVWPMPSPFPVVPEGVNSAAYPMPRAEWFQLVTYNNTNAQKIASKIELVFDGDSITSGWQSRGKDVWTARYGKLNAFDFGIGGDRTESILWRLSQGQMNGVHPKLIAIMIGTNNLRANNANEIAEGIKAIVAEYQKHCPEASILIQAIFPRGEKPTDPWRAKIKEINQTISRLADGNKVIYIDFGDKFLQPDGTISREVMADFLHPESKGYQIWADALQPTIDKFFPAAAAVKP